MYGIIPTNVAVNKIIIPVFLQINQFIMIRNIKIVKSIFLWFTFCTIVTNPLEIEIHNKQTGNAIIIEHKIRFITIVLSMIDISRIVAIGPLLALLIV